MRINRVSTVLTLAHIRKSQNTADIIDEFIAKNKNKITQDLGKFTTELMNIILNTDMQDTNIQEMILNKLKNIDVKFDTDMFDTLYMSMMSDSARDIGMSVVFDKRDTLAIKSMKKGFFWTGADYNKVIEAKLKDEIIKIFDGDVPRIEIAKQLKESFDGIVSGSSEYFAGVSDHIINQSQNVARVTQGEKHGVKHYKVVARIDSKTSNICRGMHGKII